MTTSLLAIGGYVAGWALVMTVGWVREIREDRRYLRSRD